MHSIIKNTARGLGLALAILATAGLARAAGFAIYENDARGFAMGNANVGFNDDASALYSNPAAITQLPGAQVKVGITLIQPSIDVTTGDYNSGFQKSRTFSMNSYTQVVPNLYGTYRLNDNMSVGLAVYTPYGLKSDFPQEPQSWGGAFNNYYTSIATEQITPTFAYRIVHDQPWAKSLSVGVGVGFLYTKIDIRRQLDTNSIAEQLIGAGNQLIGAGQAAMGQAYIDQGNLINSKAPLGYTPIKMDGSGWDANFNLSAQWEINDQISLGIVYRSVTRLAFHGANAQVVGITNGNAKAGITLPASWNFGVNYKPIVPLNLGFNATYTQWSSWNELNITTVNMGVFDTTETQIKNWKNVWRYSIGGEYQATNQVAVRAGFVIDKDPVNQDYVDFMVPSNDRLIYTIGLGWSINKYVTLDFAYGYLHIKGRDFTPSAGSGIMGPTNSINAGHANIVSVSGNFRF